MKKFFLFIFCSSLALIFNACSDDDEVVINPTTIELVSDDEGMDLSGFLVTVTELRSSTEFSATSDDKGKVQLNLPLGQYNLVAEKKANGVTTHYGSMVNYTLTEGSKSIKLEVKSILDALDKTFVLDELFFNCSSNESEFDRNMYEEYFTITNVSDRPLYADGLAFAVSGDYNGVEDAGDKSPYLKKDSIVVSQIYSIPGDGTQYLVQPGKSLVIAHSAVDHTEGGAKPAARDLRGADFEIFVPYEYTMTIDNPEVANLNVDYSMFQAFQWGYAGYAPMMLINPKVKLNDYVKNHLVNMEVTGGYGMKQNYLIIPTDWIVDGVETGARDYFFHKVLPDAVDRGKILIDDDEMMAGGFKSLFVKRKAADKGFLMDTNNSTEDFEVIRNGQKNYPLK